MRIVGIDPGISGALCLLDHGNVFEVVHDMPTMLRGPSSSKQAINGAELARLVRELRPDCAVVELVQAMPPRPGSNNRPTGMSAASAFNFGESAGVIRGVLAALGIATHYVVPMVWKKRAGLMGNRDKEASRALAIRLWPQAPLGLKKHQGRAEALLIARFGLRDASPAPAHADPFDMANEPKIAAPMMPGATLL